MPLITIEVTGNPVTHEQKQSLISRTTDVIVETLNKKPENTWVIIKEIPKENWGLGGISVADRS